MDSESHSCTVSLVSLIESTAKLDRKVYEKNLNLWKENVENIPAHLG